MASMINDLKNIDENMAEPEETEHDIFGKSIAAQLKKLSEEQAIIAQEKMQSILTQCRLADIRARKSKSAYPLENPESQSMQLPNTTNTTNTTKSPQYQQYSYSSVVYCPPPKPSPSATTTSYSSFPHDEDSQFSQISSYNVDSLDESTQNDDIISIAFNTA